MKIDGEASHLPVDPSLQRVAKAGRPTPTGHPEEEVSVADRVQFSSKAKEIRTAARVLAQTPETREAKVEALKRKVESGTYKVDADLIARKMVREGLLEQLV